MKNTSDIAVQSSVLNRKPLPILVLDLDETLVHFDLEKESLALRPYVRNFVRNASKSWEVVIFTAGL